jgi:phospholipase C
MDRDRRETLEAEELALHLDPEGTLRRRDFLRRTAYTAGLAGAALSPGQLFAQAARAQSSLLPSASNNPINHFVVLMMENRSFDHYFGWLSGADGIQNQSFPDPDNGGVMVSTRHASTMGDSQWQGCGHPDPGHGWDDGRAQLAGGFLAGSNDEFALTYYNEGDLGFVHPAGKAFTVYDRFHCSLMGPTWPNRYYMWSAQSGGLITNDPPVATAGNQWETLFDRALKNNPANLPSAGPTVRYYNSDLPFSATWGPRGVPWTRPVADYYAACASGTLENIVLVDPPFLDGGGGDGMSADEHPLGDVRLGQAFMSDIVHAFINSEHWRHGALFIVYDEWGGFFDHVTPPSVPDDRQNSDINLDFGQMGFRVPAVAISPYANRAAVNHTLCGFESIIKMITQRFHLGNLCTRDANANNIGTTFNYTSPHFDVPDLPDPEAVVTLPCSVRANMEDSSAQAHENDLKDLEMLADRFGFKTGTGKTDQIFTAPDGIKKALA